MSVATPPINALLVDTYGGTTGIEDPSLYVTGRSSQGSLGSWEVEDATGVMVAGPAKSISYAYVDPLHPVLGVKCTILVEGRRYDQNSPDGDDMGPGFARVDITKLSTGKMTIGAAIGDGKAVFDSQTKEVGVLGPTLIIK